MSDASAKIEKALTKEERELLRFAIVPFADEGRRLEAKILSNDDALSAARAELDEREKELMRLRHEAHECGVDCSYCDDTRRGMTATFAALKKPHGSSVRERGG